MFRPLLAALLLAAPASAQTPPEPRNAIVDAPLPPDQAAMKAHVMFLASDALKGRDTGSAEYEIAAQYVAAQFHAAGLRPAGEAGGYLQTVPLVSYKAADKGTFVLNEPGRTPRPLTFGADYVPVAHPARPLVRISGKLAFVGFGLVAPTVGRDDYAGIDVKGRIVLMFGGAPAGFNGEERAHFGSIGNKVMTAAARGAAGVILIEGGNARGARSFAQDAERYDRPAIAWAKDGDYGPYPSLAPLVGRISKAFAATLFGRRWAAIDKRSADPDKRLRSLLFDASLDVTVRSAATPLPSSNVAGLLPGGDPALKDQIVVLSAHLDHVGVGEAVNGDTIYNGAEDNAVGIAALIEEAKKFRASGKPPRRSILFLAVTAEEKGLVGADYFARRPTVPRGGIVANVNLDMPIITYRFEDVIAFGAERSTLGPIVKRAATQAGVAFSPDPMPEQGLFVRSDHYRFVQQGVPSVFLWPGQAGPGKAAVEAFFRDRYHKPSDEVGQTPALDWAQGVRFVDVNYAIAREIADADERPHWNRGDFFGTLYGGYGAQ